MSNELPKCPCCKVPFMKKNGKYGEFYGCVNYPVCLESRNIRTDKFLYWLSGEPNDDWEPRDGPWEWD